MATDRAEFIDKLRKVGFFEDPEFENAKTIDEVKLTVPRKVESELDLGFLIEKAQTNDEQTTTEATNGEENKIEQITASQILEILDNFETEKIQPDTRMVKTDDEFATLADVELEIDEISNNLNENDEKSETTAKDSIPVQANNTQDGSGDEPEDSPEITSPTENSVIQSTTTVIVEQTIKASELLSTTPILKLENNDDRFYQDLGSLFGEGNSDILVQYSTDTYHGREQKLPKDFVKQNIVIKL